MAVAIPSGDSNDNVYATVSSLYGPGTVTCWYLTTFSVLVSWTLHPHRRKSGAIDVDLIATLTLPVVAAGHLISQARLLLYRHAFDLYEPFSSVAAIEAPFVIVEIFMQISVIFFLIAAWRRAFRRLIIIGMVGLLCFAVECYIHFSNFPRLNLQHHPKARPYVAFHRYFVADFTAITIAITVLLVVVSLLSMAVLVIYARYNQEQLRLPRDENRRLNPAALQAISITARAHEDSESYQHNAALALEIEIERREALVHAHKSRVSRQMRLMTYLSTIFLPVSFLLSLFPSAMLSSNAATLGSDILGTLLRTTFFPWTSFSISDLDQAVAVAAGATILGFNLYSVMKAHYKMFSAKDASSQEIVGMELNRRGDNRHP